MPKRPKQGSYKQPPFNERFFVANNSPYKDWSSDSTTNDWLV